MDPAKSGITESFQQSELWRPIFSFSIRDPSVYGGSNVTHRRFHIPPIPCSDAMYGASQLPSDHSEVRMGAVCHLANIFHQLPILVFYIQQSLVLFSRKTQVLTVVVRFDSSVFIDHAGVGHCDHGQRWLCELYVAFHSIRHTPSQELRRVSQTLSGVFSLQKTG